MLSFNEFVHSDRLVLVDFFATWCGPCKTLAPILKELKNSIGDKAAIIKVDVDKNPGIAQQFQIQGVPTLILFKKGQPVWRQSGVVPIGNLKQVVDQFA